MQLPKFPSPEDLDLIEKSIQVERINRYLGPADGDRRSAFKFYLWNCLLSETFYPALHFCEIVCRNTLHKALKRKFGNSWYEDNTFKTILDAKFSSELSATIEKESKQHGRQLTSHHIVSALRFSFWQHLTTKRFERSLWGAGIYSIFPNAPPNATRDQLYTLIDVVRRFRNRIAHYQAIFDKNPMAKHEEIITLIKWSCADTAKYVRSISKVPQAINLRPKEDED